MLKTSSLKLTTDRLRKFAPFLSSSDNTLNFILGRSHVIEQNPGNWQPEESENNQYFLLNGAIRLQAANGRFLELSVGSPRAKYVLPVNADSKIIVSKPSRFAVIPNQALACLDSKKQQDEDQFGLQELNISGEIYIAFYDNLKAGKCDLPMMPDLALKIGRTLNDPKTDNEAIAKLIQLDPTLSTRILSVVNSAAFGGTSKITTLKNAVARLGRRQVRNLVYGIILQNLFKTDSPLLKRRMKNLWVHSCHVAAVSFILAKHTPGLDADHAMLAGLVHNIGVIPILSEARKYPEVENNRETLDTILNDMRGDIGALTLSQWGLDDSFIKVCKNAENWFYLGSALPEYIDIVLIAQLHTAIAEHKHLDMPEISEIPAFEKVADGRLNQHASLKVLQHANQEIQELRTLLQGS